MSTSGGRHGRYGPAWTGPHEVVSTREKEVVVRIDQHLAPFNVAKTKPALIPYRVHWTGILKNGDPRIESRGMQEAIKKGLDRLFKKGTFQIVVLSDVKKEKGETVYKARLVFGGDGQAEEERCTHCSLSVSIKSADSTSF